MQDIKQLEEVVETSKAMDNKNSCNHLAWSTDRKNQEEDRKKWGSHWVGSAKWVEMAFIFVPVRDCHVAQ